MLLKNEKSLDHIHPSIQKLLNTVNELIVDKEEEISLCLTSLLAGGHVLIEGLPGMGKTSLVKTLAQLLGLETKRIQFTNDMLPADIIGTSVFDSKTNAFHFLEGPLFGSFILADEINRASPKTQSALLQAMEESSVSVEGKTYLLPKPFFVFATQNPVDNVGTFPLPESQLDRFLMKIEMKAPHRSAEKQLLMAENLKTKIPQMEAIVKKEDLLHLMSLVEDVHVSDTVLEYLMDLVEKSRSLSVGLSTRAAQDFLRAAKATALLNAREFVIPEDIQSIALAVMNHRLGLSKQGMKKSGMELAKEILSSVAVPG